MPEGSIPSIAGMASDADLAKLLAAFTRADGVRGPGGQVADGIHCVAVKGKGGSSQGAGQLSQIATRQAQLQAAIGQAARAGTTSKGRAARKVAAHGQDRDALQAGICGKCRHANAICVGPRPRQRLLRQGIRPRARIGRRQWSACRESRRATTSMRKRCSGGARRHEVEAVRRVGTTTRGYLQL